MYEERYPILEPDKEQDLLRKVREGDNDALDLLIKHNARRIILFAYEADLGHSVISGKTKNWSRHVSGAIDLDELMMVSVEAFAFAAKRYDPNRHSPVANDKVRFGSWANFIMKQQLRSALTKELKRMDRWTAYSLDLDIEKLEDYAGYGYTPSRLYSAPDCRRFIVDPDIEMARDELWERIEVCVGKKGRDLISNLCDDPRQQTRLVSSRAAYDMIEKLKECIPEEELLYCYNLLMG